MEERDDLQQDPDPPASEEERVARLESDLAAARDEAARCRDRWVRERADLENVKRRAERERAEAARYGTEGLLRDLLPVVDDLERAIEAAAGTGEGAAFRQGVALVLKSLLDVLARHGVTRVVAHGGPFDPTHHEAIAHVESQAHDAGMVVEEHRGGYRLNERLLRPALVTVSKGTPLAGELANEEGRD